MRTDNNRQDTRKALSFDLCEAVDRNSSKDIYTAEEVKELIRRCVTKMP